MRLKKKKTRESEREIEGQRVKKHKIEGEARESKRDGKVWMIQVFFFLFCFFFLVLEVKKYTI